jgi:hypothetical protein
VGKYGPTKWSIIAKSLPGRIGKQCRERWISAHLRSCVYHTYQNMCAIDISYIYDGWSLCSCVKTALPFSFSSLEWLDVSILPLTVIFGLQTYAGLFWSHFV